MASQTTSRDAPPRWQRFSLRTLVLLITAVCVTMGIWSGFVNRYRQQARSLALVNQLKGESKVVPAEGSDWHRWLVETMLGDDAFVRVVEVDLKGKDVSDKNLNALTGLVFLEQLCLDQTRITDAGAESLRAFPWLKHLSVRFTSIGDQSVKQLSRLPRLETLYLTSTNVSDAAVPHLAEMQSLDHLYLRWTNVTDDGSEQLREALPKCSVVHHSLFSPLAKSGPNL